MMSRKVQLIAAGLLLTVCAGFFCLPAGAQTKFNEREVKSVPSTLDKLDVYGMDFVFKDLRMIKVKLPARGERICWYLWYQVVNYTGKPREFSPIFELVTLDNPGIYRDEILVTAEDAIRRVEDPSGYQNIKNSVLIGKYAIPASKPPEEAFPRKITGVAIWDAGPADVSKRDPKARDLRDTAQFSIFVRGLSNGKVEVDSPVAGLPPITQYKTLQLNFKRTGDRFSTDSRDIEFVPPALWIYRAPSRTMTPAKKVENNEKP